MTTEHTHKILPKRQVAIRKLHHHTDRRRAVSIADNQPAASVRINDAACEWYFERVITKECEMTAATLDGQMQ